MSEPSPDGIDFPDLELGYIGTADAEVIRGPGSEAPAEDDQEPA